MPGLARPVRMPAKSSLATSTALSIFSSASNSVSSIMALASSSLVGVAVVSWSVRPVVASDARRSSAQAW